MSPDRLESCEHNETVLAHETGPATFLNVSSNLIRRGVSGLTFERRIEFKIRRSNETSEVLRLAGSHSCGLGVTYQKRLSSRHVVTWMTPLERRI